MVTKATVRHGSTKGTRIVVDGDPNYKASTTAKALELMMEDYGHSGPSLLVEQRMGIPIGCGFGASAASAISACYAAAKVLGLEGPKEKIAYYAHVADIVLGTGLGTVSVSFDAVGAGAIVEPGGPGFSRFVNVPFNRYLRLVTASLGPYRKGDAIGDRKIVSRIRKLGDASLRRFEASPDLETLATEGERFSRSLGLMTPDVEELIVVAKESGALHASQNMIGYAVHALVEARRAPGLAKALLTTFNCPRVDRFKIGAVRAGLVSRTSELRP